VVKDGQVLAIAHRGMSVPGGHADYIALNTVPNTDLVGATLFVTLEPCTARTPPIVPCAELIRQRRLARVVVGMLDPNPVITGRGILHLRATGISVELFPHLQMREVEELNSAFAAQHGWNGTTVQPRAIEKARLIYEDLLDQNDTSSDARVVQVCATDWATVLRELRADPSRLYGLGPRKFEELVAELLGRFGFNVHLTPMTRDGGRDILARKRDTLGSQLYLVECKRYAPQNKVGVSVVRTLFGVLELERANAGVIVTTSRFSDDAVAEAKQMRHRMRLKDYDALVAWIQKAVQKKGE